MVEKDDLDTLCYNHPGVTTILSDFNRWKWEQLVPIHACTLCVHVVGVNYEELGLEALGLGVHAGSLATPGFQSDLTAHHYEHHSWLRWLRIWL